jgi:hypothetical protein
MEESTIVLMVFLGLVSLTIFFFIIFFAVRWASAPLLRQLRILTYMKAGMDIKTALGRLEEYQQLKKQRGEGRINQAQFEEAEKEFQL